MEECGIKVTRNPAEMATLAQVGALGSDSTRGAHQTRWARFRSNDGRTGFGVVRWRRISSSTTATCSARRARPARTLARERVSRCRAPARPPRSSRLWNNFHALARKARQAGARRIRCFSSSRAPRSSDRTSRSAADRLRRARSPTRANSASSSANAARTSRRRGRADYIFGYTCVNDVTAAEVLNENADFAQWCRSKGYDTFGCLGSGHRHGCWIGLGRAWSPGSMGSNARTIRCRT